MLGEDVSLECRVCREARITCLAPEVRRTRVRRRHVRLEVAATRERPRAERALERRGRVRVRGAEVADHVPVVLVHFTARRATVHLQRQETEG